MVSRAQKASWNGLLARPVLRETTQSRCGMRGNDVKAIQNRSAEVVTHTNESSIEAKGLTAGKSRCVPKSERHFDAAIPVSPTTDLRSWGLSIWKRRRS